ncbi:MAG TPA: hypothetical protein GX732_02540 [Pseudomonas sp.]|nr:hypothetical protein [Pseudomonas sp.]
MTQIIWRSLLAFSLAMALSACQAPAKQISEPVIDQFAVSAQVFDTYVEGNQLVAAEQQLQTLGADYSDDERLPALQQRLAAAWLKNGQQALQDSDVLAASTALMHAKRLMPQAPALTEGLSTALAEVQAQVVPPVIEQEIVKPVVKPPAAAKPAPRVPARKIATPIKTAPAVTVIEPTVMEPKLEQAPLATTKPRSKKARIIDPLADSTTLPMPMLASRNDHQLGRLLDDVASDVVRFRAAVSIEVADTRDFHWVATLLSARVKKLDASFKPRLQEVIRSDSPAQLVITPNKSL